MHPNSRPRRVHSAEFKAAVLAACNDPGASIAGVALAHGLNANLVRKWRGGRDVKRTGLLNTSLPSAQPSPRPSPSSPPLLLPDAQFLPIHAVQAVQAAAPPVITPVVGAGGPSAARPVEPTIQIELRRGPVNLAVRWPGAGAADCAQWLREFAAGLLK
jgi:transposase